MAVNQLIELAINGSVQWLLVKGNERGPLLLHVQAGPGLPLIPEAESLEKLHQFEKEFLVVYWDQRGCGKSYSASLRPETISIRQLTLDLLETSRQLLEKYQKKEVNVIGYSIGASISLLAASEKKELFGQLFLVGMDIDMPSANLAMMDFAFWKATIHGHSQWINTCLELSKRPIAESATFQKRARLMTDMGGMHTGLNFRQLLLQTLKNMWRSPAYRISDILRTMKGMAFCQNAFLTELNSFTLLDKKLEMQVPVHFLHGEKDQVSPFQMAVTYISNLQAVAKSLTAFKQSAHMPHYEEAERFRELIVCKLTERSIH